MAHVVPMPDATAALPCCCTAMPAAWSSLFSALHGCLDMETRVVLCGLINPGCTGRWCEQLRDAVVLQHRTRMMQL